MVEARTLRGLIIGLIVLAAGGPAARAADLNELLKPDPSVVMGRLANGLRYAVKQQPSHQKEIITFYIGSGSLEETDEERGAAHFLEHMAFNGSRAFPAATLIKTFEAAGIGLGRDQNAFTTYLNTTYNLNIPNENSDKLDLSFRWLRDVADGLTIDPAEVDRERGVIKSEYRQGESPARDLLVKKFRYLTPGLRFADRLPISNLGAIQGMTAEGLRGYYRKWYRPENAILVAVGDQPTDVMIRRIEATFSSWRNPSEEPPRPGPGRMDFLRPRDAESFFDAHLSGAVGICRYAPKPEHRPEDVRSTRERLADQIWTSVFGRRMARLARSETAPFLQAGAAYAVSLRAVSETCFSAVEKSDDWTSALSALWREIGRLERYGVTKREFEDLKAQIIANDDAAVASAATRAPEVRAASILSNMVEGDTFDTEVEQRRVDGLALDSLTASDVSAQVRKRWTQASPPLFFSVGPARIEPKALLEVADKAPEAGPPADVEARPFAYGAAKVPGRVVSRQTFADPAFVRLTFANGVVLNFKQTGFVKNSVSIRISFGAGQEEVDPPRVFDATMGGALFAAGALGKNDATDLAETCQGRACGAQLQVNRGLFSLSGTTRPADLDLELQLLSAYLSDPGFRPEMAAAMPTAAAAFYRNLNISPPLLAARALEAETPLPHVADTPSEATMAGLKAEDFRRVLQGPLTSDPLEATIVGDVDEAAAVAAVSRTLGALAARAPGDRTRPDAVRLRFAAQAPAPLTITHQGAVDQAYVQVTWPVFVWTPERASESRALNLLSRILKDALIDRLRQALGQTYVPNVFVNLPRGGDQGSVTVAVLTTPGSADLVRSEILAIASGLATRGAGTEAFTRARTPWLESLAKERTYNSWWLGVLDASARYPDKLVEARNGLDALSAVSLEAVDQSARRWLAAPPYLITVLPKSLSKTAPAPGRAPPGP